MRPLTSSDSPKTCLLSEWPRMTHAAPISLIIAGLGRKEMTHWRKSTSQRHPDFTLCGSPDLSCESSLWYLVTVLRCHSNLCIELLTGKVKVDGGGSTNHLCKAKHVATLVTGKRQKLYLTTDPKCQPQDVISLSWEGTACPSSLTSGEPCAIGQFSAIH